MASKPLSRREENRLARRAAIIAVAQESFLEHGYAATSMSDIATALGGSKGTLWAHFPSKEDLFTAVLEDAISAFRAALEDAFQPGRDQRATLQAFGRRFATKLQMPNSVCLHRIIVSEGARFPQLGPIFYEHGPRRVIELLVGYLGREMAEGRMRRADPIIAARHLIGMLQAHQNLRLWNVAPPFDQAEQESQADLAVDAFLRAYAPD
ncbi:TetR/AcrR family transcriptional regulator [Sphingomonas naphthae]|uniref:TetR/AcrR family transcriptional regulator n=1 Tax=Sphingomonas naphthae TaxID=1813468 RepID=A0ABY7TMV7_9SPHN|nr:TetR/AcrR family transcriptional regulator [Sphingomonas naphthae]WCT74333.1 TetR/AcrR family transcriptional regulator [Sphingomonas naphthae]